MSKYRSKNEIIAEILTIAQGGASKSRIISRAYLAYPYGLQYLEDLVRSGLLALDDENIYSTTDKGQEWLILYGRLAELTLAV